MCDYCAYMPTNILGLNVFVCTECSLCFYAQMCKAQICVHVFVSLHTKHLCFCINLSAYQSHKDCRQIVRSEYHSVCETEMSF